MAATVRPGDAIALDVHVVNDLRTPLDGAVTARMTWRGGEHAWRWGGDVAADSCTRVGMARFVVPDAPGPLEFDLDLDYPDGAASNRYTTTIARKR
jgi:hypothetical protein